MSTQTQTNKINNTKVSRVREDDGIIDDTSLDLKRNPLIKHFREKNRIVTIVYTKDKESNLIAYGAVIFHNSGNKNVSWNRLQHIETATQRFRKFPLVVQSFPYYENKEEYYKNFYNNLRRCVHKFGVANRIGEYFYDWNMPHLVNDTY